MDTLIALLAIVVGILAGVLLALLLDGYSLGRMLDTAVTRSHELTEQAHAAEKALAVAQHQARRLEQQWQETAARVNELTQENQALQNRLTAAAVAVKTQRQVMTQFQQQWQQREVEYQRPVSSSVAADGLQTIHGIGPVYARRLRDEGVITVSDLIEHSPERLAEIVGLKGGLAQKTADWLQQAQEIIGNR